MRPRDCIVFIVGDVVKDVSVIFSLTGDGRWLPNVARVFSLCKCIPWRIQDAFIMKISISRAVADVPLGNSCSCYVASLEKRGRRGRERGRRVSGRVSVNALVSDTRAEVYATAFTHATPSWCWYPFDPHARAPFYSMSRCSSTFGTGAPSGCASGIAGADEIVDLRSGDVFPDNVKSSNARDSYGIPAAEVGDGYRKAGRMNDSRADLSAESKRPRLPRIGIRDSARPARCYQFLIADRKIFPSQTRNTCYL